MCPSMRRDAPVQGVHRLGLLEVHGSQALAQGFSHVLHEHTQLFNAAL